MKKMNKRYKLHPLTTSDKNTLELIPKMSDGHRILVPKTQIYNWSESLSWI